MIDRSYKIQTDDKKECMVELKNKHYNSSIFIIDVNNKNIGFVLNLLCSDDNYLSDLEVNSIWAIRDLTNIVADLIEVNIDCSIDSTASYYPSIMNVNELYPMSYCMMFNAFEKSILECKDEMIQLFNNKLSDEFKKYNQTVKYIQLDMFERYSDNVVNLTKVDNFLKHNYES